MLPPPPSFTLFPYTTLFRSALIAMDGSPGARAALRFLSLFQLVRDARVSLFHVLQGPKAASERSEEHTSELQSHSDLVCRLLLGKRKVLKGMSFRICLRSRE